MADETWDDTFDYGVSRGFIWQDTQCGLPKFTCEKLIILVTRILEQASVNTRDGVIQFEDLHIRWWVKQKQPALVF